MKKAILFIVLCVIGKTAFCQDSSYTLPLPEKWGSEKIKFPISFAPQIPYTGIEELRFTPGWSKAETDEYWSYTFLWFIEGTPDINAGILQGHFTGYFNGLFKSNNKTKQPAGDNFTEAKISNIKTAAGDQQTYEGKISTLNFLTGKSLELFARIHIRNYPGSNHSALLVELSPKAYAQPVWKELDGIVTGFEYKK